MSNRTHAALLRAAEKAADALHQDTSVDLAETMVSLKQLHEHVGILIDSVASDLSTREEE